MPVMACYAHINRVAMRETSTSVKLPESRGVVGRGSIPDGNPLARLLPNRQREYDAPWTK